MKYSVLLLLLLLIFGSCGSSTNKPIAEATNIVINANDINPNFVDEIQSITVMKIDSRVLISELPSIEMDRNYIYMLDGFNGKKLFIINRSDGKLKNTIDRQGNSNSEYISAMGFQVDSKTKDIYILDSQKKMVKQYNSSGEFLNNINLPCYAPSFLMNGDGTMWIDKGNTVPFMDGSGKSLALIDMKTEEVIANYYDVPDYNKNVNLGSAHISFKGDSLMTYLPSMSNTVYSIIGEDIIPKYYFDFGNKWPSKDRLEEFGASINSMSILEKWRQKEYVLFLNYLESAEWLHVNFGFKGELLGYFFNKKSQKGSLYNLEDLGRPLYIENDNTFVFAKYEEEYTSLVFVTL